uniref:Uncharacterized protein n=1 Tax=Strigamia maritima TaxID=126957 RepID=T1IR67_STRMM
MLAATIAKMNAEYHKSPLDKWWDNNTQMSIQSDASYSKVNQNNKVQKDKVINRMSSDNEFEHYSEETTDDEDSHNNEDNHNDDESADNKNTNDDKLYTAVDDNDSEDDDSEDSEDINFEDDEYDENDNEYDKNDDEYDENDDQYDENDDDSNSDDFVNYGQDTAIAPVLPRILRNGCVYMDLPSIAYVLPHDGVATRSIVRYKDYVVYVDSRPKTSVWTEERITKKNWAQVEHRHLELNRFACRMPPDFKFGRPDNDKRATLVKLISHKLRKVNGQMVCACCAYSNFWKVFHQYIAFLLKLYEDVHVCSGVLQLNKEDVKTPSHYFKVLCCENEDDLTYRFECYKISNERMTSGTPELRKYLVSRKELEKLSGLRIFDHVRDNRIAQRETHILFFHPALG